MFLRLRSIQVRHRKCPCFRHPRRSVRAVRLFRRHLERRSLRVALWRPEPRVIRPAVSRAEQRHALGNGSFRRLLDSLRGWPPLLLLPVAVVLLAPPEWPRWAFMWALAFSIYAGCKWLTWRRTPAAAAPWWRHVGYLFAW